MKTYKLVWENQRGQLRWLTFRANSLPEATSAFQLARSVGMQMGGNRFALRTTKDKHLAGWEATVQARATPANNLLDV